MSTTPSFLGFVTTLLVVGAIGELLYKLSPTAGYGFILIVILGYMATGGHLETITKFYYGITKG